MQKFLTAYQSPKKKKGYKKQLNKIVNSNSNSELIAKSNFLLNCGVTFLESLSIENIELKNLISERQQVLNLKTSMEIDKIHSRKQNLDLSRT